MRTLLHSFAEHHLSEQLLWWLILPVWILHLTNCYEESALFKSHFRPFFSACQIQKNYYKIHTYDNLEELQEMPEGD